MSGNCFLSSRGGFVPVLVPKRKEVIFFIASARKKKKVFDSSHLKTSLNGLVLFLLMSRAGTLNEEVFL